MLTQGLQGFHGSRIAVPGAAVDRPDPARLAFRFDRFSDAA